MIKIISPTGHPSLELSNLYDSRIYTREAAYQVQARVKIIKLFIPVVSGSLNPKSGKTCIDDYHCLFIVLSRAIFAYSIFLAKAP